jgi:hypothetical protein
MCIELIGDGAIEADSLGGLRDQVLVGPIGACLIGDAKICGTHRRPTSSPPATHSKATSCREER